MKAHEIIENYFDITRMTPENYNKIIAALERLDSDMDTDTTRSAFLQAMYGHDVERKDLELEQLRLDNAKTRAEIKALDAEAARDRAAARR